MKIAEKTAVGIQTEVVLAEREIRREKEAREKAQGFVEET